MDDTIIYAANKRRGRMPPVNDMTELLEKAADIAARYRYRNSVDYSHFLHRKRQAELFYSGHDYNTLAANKSYFQSIQDWGDAIFEHYWGLGAAAAVLEFQQPDKLLYEDAELLHKLKSPDIPGLDKLERIMHSRCKKMRSLLPDDDKPQLDEHLLLSKQEAWDNAPFAFVQGYEEGLRLLCAIGFKENTANLKWIYWEYLPK